MQRIKELAWDCLLRYELHISSSGITRSNNDIYLTGKIPNPVDTSETSVHSNETTQHYIPEDSKLHTRRRENVNSYNHVSENDCLLGYFSV
jgi:hypothetical protein